MKLNPKIYKQLTGEPFEVQEIDGKKVSFYFMDDTPFMTQFANRGRFVLWTSDGNDYKVLIESSYYNQLKPFYEYEINSIWMEFLNEISDISRKINLWFMVPTLVLYVVIAALSVLFFPNQMIYILIVLLILVFISNMVQTNMTQKRVKAKNVATQQRIRELIGGESFDDLVKAQEQHYKDYFKFEEEVKAEDAESNELDTKDEIEEPTIENNQEVDEDKKEEHHE